LLEIEELMLKEFRRTHPPFAEYETKSDWDLLATAQHHGLPTRLLDWTYSALAAMWFAIGNCRGIDRCSRNEAIVWILKSWKRDFLNFPTGLRPLECLRTQIFRPRIIARRIVAQSGVFTLHKMLRKGDCVPLEKDPHFMRNLVKIIVPRARFASICEQLHICGVNHSTMFPDLDGLCQHLEWRYTKESPKSHE
jgi:hypothetical protein